MFSFSSFFSELLIVPSIAANVGTPVMVITDDAGLKIDTTVSNLFVK